MTAFGVDTKGGALRCLFWGCKRQRFLFGLFLAGRDAGFGNAV
jgi:hypothetical protein